MPTLGAVRSIRKTSRSREPLPEIVKTARGVHRSRVTDLAALVAGFDHALRAHGVTAGPRRSSAFADVLVAMPPVSGAGFYWRARTAMLPGIRDLAAFNAAFAKYFSGQPAGDAALDALAAALGPQVERIVPEPAERTANESDAQDAPLRLVAATHAETLAERSFVRSATTTSAGSCWS